MLDLRVQLRRPAQILVSQANLQVDDLMSHAWIVGSIHQGVDKRVVRTTTCGIRAAPALLRNAPDSLPAALRPGVSARSRATSAGSIQPPRSPARSSLARERARARAI